MPPLTETTRPTRLDDVIAQDKAIARIKALTARGLGGRVLWITGASGTGKTTIARILATMHAPDYQSEENARDVDMSWVERFEKAQLSRPLGAGGQCWILNESHLLRPAIVSRLLTTLEALAPHSLVIFTTTSDNMEKWEDSSLDAAPFLSRCVKLPLSRRDLCEPFAQHCKRIAEQEGLATADVPLAKYERLLKNHGNNLRSAINAIEAGEML